MASNNQPVDDLISTLRTLMNKRLLGGYITHIRFPLFKNIERNARIEFEFPVTALVGPNGSGKTSALHALYGAPRGMSTSDFWFATDLDPIREGQGEPHRFIYGHWLQGESKPVETRKARVSGAGSQRRKPGYFEPTKAVKGDHMDMSPWPASGKKPGQSKDRWNPVDRPLLYINFRSELSAFDKFLFWATPKSTKRFPNKYERLQAGARKLNEVIRSGAQSAHFRTQRMVFENRDLSDNEIQAISQILGKHYTGAKLVRHSYYGRTEGVSLKFKTGHSEYSEAFAGSGELAVASLVVQVLSAEKYSLILLDEPEVSLHPRAQEQLLLFLMEQAKSNHHQVVFTTHSPSMVRFLPPNAIKVFYETAGGAFAILGSAHPYAAFSRLGAPVPNKVRVYVEDRLAKFVVEVARLNLPEADRELVEVEFLPGGANTYYGHRIPTLMHEGDHTYLYLDGDAKPGIAIPDPRQIPEGANDSLEGLITRLTGCEVQLGADGGNDLHSEEKKVKLRRKYLAFLHDRVHFLPKACPEQVILTALGYEDENVSCQEAKRQLAGIVLNAFGSNTAEEIDNYARTMLANEREQNADLREISGTLQSLVNRL